MSKTGKKPVLANLKIASNLVYVAILVGLGGVVGYQVRDYFCPDEAQARLDVLEKDAVKVGEIEKATEIKYVYRDKIKTVIQAAPAGECFDAAIPATAADGLLQSYNLTRPPADRADESARP